MRPVLVPLIALALAPSLAAQTSEPPAGLAQLEIERSRTCVDILTRLRALDDELAPLAQRAQRLLAVAEAIALEDERVVDLLDTADSLEARVHAWFVRDQELARRYVATLAEELNDQRAEAREAIKTVVAGAIQAVQQDANARVEASGNLPRRAGPCDGAIFVRSAVVEACAGAGGALCEAARAEPSTDAPFRFVDDPEAIWEVTQVRPWTNPTPLQVTPDGQLDGARTIGYARTGNVVVSVAFSPLLRDRAELTPEEAQAYASTIDSLGLSFTHPEIAFVPALGLRATLPNPLGGESRYVLHFGPPDDADVLWSGAAGSGAPIERTVRLGAAQVGRLRAGEPLAFTALREEAGQSEPVFTIELTSMNQTRASQALLGYMAQQLGRDLAQLVRPRGGP